MQLLKQGTKPKQANKKRRKYEVKGSLMQYRTMQEETENSRIDEMLNYSKQH